MGGAPELEESGLRYAFSLEDEIPRGLTWDDFRIFLAVVQTGSVNRAAVHLGLSQPTASRRLSRLEQRLGTRLFDRDRTGPRLTHHGRRILNDVSAAGYSLNRASRAASSLQGRIEGDCRVVMGDGLATYWMPQFLGQFYDQHPNIELKMFVAQDSTAGKNEAFDVQLHYYEPVEVDPVTIRVATLHFVPFASRSYLETHDAPKKMSDLANHRMMEMAAYRVDKGPWSDLMKGAELQTAPLLTNQSAPLAEAVRKGIGIALLPTYIVTTDSNFVPLDVGLHLPAPVFMSFQREVAKKWSVRAVVDFLRDTVFQRKTMPWFSDQFIFPDSTWTFGGSGD
ncbi:MAG TPA: LysR family transcriptional regulator [Rhizomicrobium sp.]|nr:LysR family transcriptional regulator [Rhizomicrobium sp.]